MKANVWAARLMALVALSVLIATLIGLERVPLDSTWGQISRRLSLWAIGAALLWGSFALVLWPRQLVARNAIGIGTRRPSFARAFGCLGILVGFFFMVVVAQGKGRFEGDLFVASLVCSGVIVWWGLSRLKKTMNRG